MSINVQSKFTVFEAIWGRTFFGCIMLTLNLKYDIPIVTPCSSESRNNQDGPEL